MPASPYVPWSCSAKGPWHVVVLGLGNNITTLSPRVEQHEPVVSVLALDLLMHSASCCPEQCWSTSWCKRWHLGFVSGHMKLLRATLWGFDVAASTLQVWKRSRQSWANGKLKLEARPIATQAACFAQGCHRWKSHLYLQSAEPQKVQARASPQWTNHHPVSPCRCVVSTVAVGLRPRDIDEGEPRSIQTHSFAHLRSEGSFPGYKVHNFTATDWAEPVYSIT